MRGLILAAGRGLRMGQLTESQPKCLLKVAGRTLLEHTVEGLTRAGCSEIILVVGYKAEKIAVPGVCYVTNHDYANNNILHSLMTARNYLVGPVIVSYSDIWVEPWIYRRLTDTAGEIVIAVDRDWQGYYQGRTEHPVSEAEKVHFDRQGFARQLGKHLAPDPSGPLTCGEFLGLWRMSLAGTQQFCEVFDEVDARVPPAAPFQHASSWRNAYIGDMMQELVDRGEGVRCAVIERGWAEMDTPQDYQRLADIAGHQRLETLISSRVNL